MKSMLVALLVMSLLFVSAVRSQAWSVYVENKCEKTPANDAKINISVYSHQIFKMEYEGGVSLRPGKSHTFQMSGAWCVGYLAFNEIHKVGCSKAGSGVDTVGVPCCWDVYYVATGKGGQCTVKLK